MRRSEQLFHLFSSKASRTRLLERSKMTLEQLEAEHTEKLLQRRRLDLINPNRSLTWDEIREDGDLGVHIMFNAVFYTFFGGIAIYTGYCIFGPKDKYEDKYDRENKD